LRGVALPVLGEARNSIRHGGRLGFLELLVTPGCGDVGTWVGLGKDDANVAAVGRVVWQGLGESMRARLVTGWPPLTAALTIAEGRAGIGPWALVKSG